MTHMNTRWFHGIVLGLLGTMVIQIRAEVIRVVPLPALGPGHHEGVPLDLNSDGRPEFLFSISTIITLDYPTSGASTIISLHPFPEVSVAGHSIYTSPLSSGELLGPELNSDLEWVATLYRFDVASRGHSFRTGRTSTWSGVLGDPAKPFLGIRFPGETGYHYGWIRFGHAIGADNSLHYLSSSASIIEWAYEAEPDTPITIELPEIHNDSFSSASEVSGSTFRLWTDNSHATTESGEPNPGQLGAGGSLWWRWTAPADGHLSLASATGPFATIFGVYTGGSLEELVEVAASKWSCLHGSPAITRQAQFPVSAGAVYHIKVDSLAVAGGAAPRGEIHLEGVFGTVGLIYPSSEFAYSAGSPIYMLATISDWDGPRHAMTFEANGLQVASTLPGEVNALWHDPEPGRHEVRAVWHSTDGTVRRSPPVTIHVRPANDDFFFSPFIQTTPITIRASNHYASKEAGEPAPPAGAGSNSVWWRWTAPADGVVTIDIPDANGELSIAACWGYGPWVSNVTEITSNPVDPSHPNRRLNHIQFAVISGNVYAIAVRSLVAGAGSWLPPLPCEIPLVPGRDFTLRMDFDSIEAGNLLVKQFGHELLASFVARPDRVYVLESSPDLTRWDPVKTGVTSGVMQWLSVGIHTEQPAQFFRIRLNP